MIRKYSLFQRGRDLEVNFWAHAECFDIALVQNGQPLLVVAVGRKIGDSGTTRLLRAGDSKAWKGMNPQATIVCELREVVYEVQSAKHFDELRRSPRHLLRHRDRSPMDCVEFVITVSTCSAGFEELDPPPTVTV